MPASTRFFVTPAIALLAIVLPVRANEPVTPDQQKASDVAAEATPKKDAPPSLQVTDAARPVLEKVKQSYAKLGGLQTSGTWAAEWDVDGDVGKQVAEFTSIYAAPNRYRHEVKDDLLFGSTGEKVFAFRQNQYLMSDAPKSRGGVDDLSATYGILLKEKNPSLLLAVTDDETPFLAEKATRIDKGADVTIGGTAYPSLVVAIEEGATATVLIDPATHLMRQWSIDLKPSLEKRGQQNVKLATMTIDYATTKAEPPAAGDAFAWAPPSGAKDAARSQSIGEEEARKLVGKPAPDFTLEDLDGNKVRLKDVNKDHVVVLDLWATWCPPCREGLPVLQRVMEARKDKKLKVYAVNLEEDKQTVAKFVKDSSLAVPVLLDLTGDTGRAYLVSGIPQTVIIGKDGIVRDVIFGAGPQPKLEELIDAAMK